MANLDIKVGSRTAVEVASDAEMERQRWADEASKGAEAERPMQGGRLYDIVDLVKEIKYDGAEKISETQKQEIAEIQLAKLNRDFYIDPGRLAMIDGGAWRPEQLAQRSSYRPDQDGPLSVPYASEIDTQAFLVAALAAGRQKAERAREDSARKMAIRDCEMCFRQRRRNDRRPCEQHRNRNLNDNVMTSVPLCPHIDMRLFWLADDAANKKDSWRLDVSDVHPHDIDTHTACKFKSVEDALDELVGLLEKSMQRRNLRASNLSRVVRQLPAVWDLLIRDEKTGVVEVTHTTPTNLPPPEYDPYGAGGIVPLIGQYTGVHRRVRAEGHEPKNAGEMQRRNARRAKRVMGTRRKGRVVVSEYQDAETRLPDKKTATAMALLKEKKTAEPENRFTLSKSIARPTKRVEATSRAEKPAEQATDAKSTTKKAAPKMDRPETQASSKKSKMSEEIIYDSDEGLSDNEVAAPTVDAPPKNESLKRKIPEDEVTQHPLPETNVATPEPSVPDKISSANYKEQSTSSKKRKASHSSASVVAKKRKTSIAEEQIARSPEPRQPTSTDTSSATPVTETLSRSPTPLSVSDADEGVEKSSGRRRFSQRPG
ncbi:hypothetical protein PMIN02_000557 [Paraphaeosphaeria minitans]